MKENSHQKLLNLFKKKGGFFNNNLTIKKDVVNSYSVIATDDIKPNEDLINVPSNQLILQDTIRNLKQFDNNFTEVYFEFLGNNSSYLDTHPLNCNNLELEKISKTIKNNKNLYVNFTNKFKNFRSLNDDEKKIELLASTRAISIREQNKYKKYFMPMMDFVNYNYFGLEFRVGNKGNVYLKSEKLIKKNEEILVNYSKSHEAISFFFEHGFIDSSFNSFKIKKNELKLNLNNISTFNKNYFSKDNNIYTFTEDIDFIENKFSKNFIKFLEILPKNERFASALGILDVYKNSIILDDNDFKSSIILKNFYKSVKLYLNIIDNYLKLITRNYEKN